MAASVAAFPIFGHARPPQSPCTTSFRSRIGIGYFVSRLLIHSAGVCAGFVMGDLRNGAAKEAEQACIRAMQAEMDGLSADGLLLR